MLIHKNANKAVVCITKEGIPSASGVILSIENYLFLCTCKHVVDSKPDYFVANSKEEEKIHIPLNLSLSKCHDRADIALCPITKNMFANNPDLVSVGTYGMLLYGSQEFEKLGLGDIVFALGFPNGIDGKRTTSPILRGGFIAKLDRESIEEQCFFWIDSHIFPGNSGGPVFLKPELASISPTTSINNGYLLGIASALRYFDVPIKINKDDDPVNNRWHSGLSEVVPIHYAMEIYNCFFAKTLPRP